MDYLPNNIENGYEYAVTIVRKNVIAVKIKENPIKPISKKGRCLKRVDSSNRSMSAQEVAQMHLHSTGMSWDKYPAKDTSLEDIDIDNVNRYIRKARETGRKKVGDDEEYLRSLNLNERQIKAVMYVKEKGQITNKEYQEVCATSKRTASRDLAGVC